MSASRLLRAHLALLLCALIYSGWNVVAARCLAVVSPITFSLVRELASIVVLYAWAAAMEGPLRMPSPSDRLRFVALGAVLAAFQLCFAVGVAMAGAQMAALFQCIEPSTAAVIGALVGAEPPTRAKALSALLAGGGVLIMQLGGGTVAPDGHAPNATQTAVGSVLLLLQGVGISCYCLLQKALVRGAPAAPLAPSAPSPQPPSPPLAAWAEAGSPEASGTGGDAPAASPATAAASAAAAAEGGGAASDAKQRLLPTEASHARAHGAVTVTAHAYCSSLLVMLLAAALDAALQIETPSPLSRAQLRRLATPLSAAAAAWVEHVAVAYAVLLASVVGYSLRAWANRHVDAGVLVLYNAVQPPLTALLLLAVAPADARYGWRELVGSALVMGAVGLSALDARRSRRLAERLGRDS